MRKFRNATRRPVPALRPDGMPNRAFRRGDKVGAFKAELAAHYMYARIAAALIPGAVL